MLCKTAGVLVVSEASELPDAVLEYAAKQLHALNYHVDKAVTVPCNQGVLEAEIETSIKRCSVVILVGGIGELYASSVSHALSKVFHQELLKSERLTQLLATKVSACIPAHAKVLEYSTFNSDSINNVHVQPVVYIQGLLCITGNLEELEQSLSSIVAPFLSNFSSRPVLKRRLIMHSVQNNNFALKVHHRENVDVSYEQREFNVIVTLSSASMSSLLACEKSFKEAYGGSLLRCEGGGDIVELVYQQMQYPFVRKSIECIEECFARFGPENVFISFNGGKDCTVLLHMALGVLRKNYPEHTRKTFCMYIESANPFPELQTFISQCQHYYDLDIHKLSKSIKDSLAFVLDSQPHMKACLMGTRRTDPFSENLHLFQMTDPNWPQVMRVSPLLDWHYSEIWDYLLHLKVPYCSLYDMGYTSLGSMTNTVPNPSLAVSSSCKEGKVYLPAYKLLDASKERHGRKQL